MNWGRWGLGLTMAFYSVALRQQLTDTIHGLGYGDWRDAVAPTLTWVLYGIEALGMAMVWVEGFRGWVDLGRTIR